MNLGIYGDSHADGQWGNIDNQTSWTKELLEKSKIDGKCYGASGTSTWWSYEEFLSTHEKYNNIIFSYSYFGRWPILPEALKGNHWNTNIKHIDPFNHAAADLMEPYNKLYNNIFNVTFFEFIEYNIFKSVNEICKSTGKYLINVIPEGFKYDPLDTDFPVFYNLNKISYQEKIVRDGKIHNLSQLHINESIMDKRHCHLNNLNNKLLAETLKETLKNKKTKIIVDLFKELKWQEFDPMMQSVYGYGFKRGLL